MLASGSPATATRSSVTLPHSPHSASQARLAVGRALADLRVPGETRTDVLVVVSELVGNAVRYAAPLTGGGIEVGWTVEPDEIIVEVADGGIDVLRAHPDVNHPDSSPDEGGRGLLLVTALTTEAHRLYRDGIGVVRAVISRP
jgi:anti-sigma regulatory factor (Ser/Thr protein kinase)